MDNKALREFALYARCELDKLPLSLQEKKNAFISMIMHRCSVLFGTEDFSFEENIIPEYIKQKFSSGVPSEELSHVETIGWLYQYFVNSDRAQTVDAIGGHDISDSDVSAATQVFTPDWIVKFLVDNSLGRFFKENTNHSLDLKYCINSFSRYEKTFDIKKVTFFDPSCGSGHILVYAFDVFMQMYLALGYSPKDAAKNILKYNLYGADIDPFAVKLCKFQLVLKAAKYGAKEKSNIYLFDSADAIGSLRFDDTDKLLGKKFTVVCTNPPYLANVGGEIKKYINEHMKPYSKDLFTAFMYRGLCYCAPEGYMAYMTPNVWMFLSSHKGIRDYILDNKTICSLAQLGKGAYFSEASVDICAFVIKNSMENEEGVYIRLEDFPKNLESQDMATKNAINMYNDKKVCPYLYVRPRDYFYKIPGNPVAYWVNEAVHRLFEEKTIGDVFTVKQGMTTGNNKRFLKYWYKVPFDAIGFSNKDCIEAKNSGKRWFPYNKGGKFRKWYGNNEYVVLYENDGQEIKEYTSHLNQGTWVRLKSRDYYFKESVTWSFISSSHFGVRFSPVGSIFDVAGSSLFGENLIYVLAFLSTKTAFYLLQMINPSMNYQIRDIKSLPFIMNYAHAEHIESLAKKCIKLSTLDWDSREISYGFKTDPLIELSQGKKSLKLCLDEYMKICQDRFCEVFEAEKELNNIFADMYGLKNHINHEVSPEDITLNKFSRADGVKNLISYCVGCAFGRYNYDNHGVVSCKKKVMSIKETENFVLNMLKKHFDDTDYLISFLEEKDMTHPLAAYLKKDFIKRHKKQYHNNPIYFKDGDNLIYDVER